VLVRIGLKYHLSLQSHLESLTLVCLSALITLAFDSSGLQEIQQLGIIDLFSALLEDETLNIRENLRRKMQDLVNVPLHDESCFEDHMSEDETCNCLFVNLKAILTRHVDSKQTLSLQANTVAAMQKFPNNNNIQETGCKLLACIFSSSGRNAATCLEAVTKCISSSQPMTVAAAASAFRNVCSSQASSQLDSFESQQLVSEKVLAY
jgi:hypothetical protein